MTRKLLPLLLLALSAPAWGAYAYKATITVPHTQVSGSSNLPSFTVCGKLSDTSFKPSGGGGQIQHSVTVNGQVVPADLIFATDTSGAVSMNWEIISWDQSGGNVYYCSLVSSLSYTSDNLFYVFYGNSATTTFQGGSVGSAWDSNTVFVAHLANISALVDSSVSGNVLTNYSATQITTAPYGNGIGLNGSSQYVSVADSVSLKPASQLTLSVLMDQTTNVTWPSTVSKMVNSGTHGYGLYEYSNNTTWLGQVGNTNTIGVKSYSINTWYHQSVTYNGASVVLYQNGVLDASLAMTGAIPQDTTPMRIGTNGSFSLYFTGYVAEIRLANTARTPSWLVTESNNAAAPATFAAVSGIGACVGTCGAGGSAATVTMTPIIM